LATPAITIESLAAGYGDCLLVSCPIGQRTWRLLIDTGPDECLPALTQRLQQLPVDAGGNRRIDLAVISHIDHDHIGGARALFADQSLKLVFGDVWFNAPRKPSTRGVAEGVGLASVLGDAARGLPWNLAFEGEDIVTRDALFVEVPGQLDEPRITLLSPTRHRLDALYRLWAKELPKVRLRPEPAPLVVTRGALDIPALAARATALDGAPANSSSIAFLLEHRGAAALLTADAFPQVLVPALKALAAHRGIDLPWTLDLIKLSHHGSRGNTTNELMQVVRATDNLVSTNGAIFGHPDAEGVARVVLGGQPNSRLWFNYRTPRTERWASEDLCRQYGYTAHYPEGEQSGVVIHIPSRR
jgi:beta-lactamase superfamily II metal-dependent hydrolase